MKFIFQKSTDKKHGFFDMKGSIFRAGISVFVLDDVSLFMQ